MDMDFDFVLGCGGLDDGGRLVVEKKEEEELGRGDERFNFGILVCDFVVYKGFGCFGV